MRLVTNCFIQYIIQQDASHRRRRVLPWCRTAGICGPYRGWLAFQWPRQAQGCGTDRQDTRYGEHLHPESWPSGNSPSRMCRTGGCRTWAQVGPNTALPTYKSHTVIITTNILFTVREWKINACWTKHEYTMDCYISRLGKYFNSMNQLEGKCHLCNRCREIENKFQFRGSVHHTMITENTSLMQQDKYTGCNRRNGPDFGRVFLMLNYTEKPQNTYIQSWTVSEITASEVWNFDSCYTLTDYQIHIETGRNMWFL